MSIYTVCENLSFKILFSTGKPKNVIFITLGSEIYYRKLINWVIQKLSTLISQQATVHIYDWLTKVKQIYEPFCLLVHVRTIKCLIVKANKIKNSWFHVILIGVLKWPITQSFLTISSSLPAITLWLLSTKLFLITSWNTHMWSFCHFMYHVSLLTDVPFTFSLCNGVCITLWLATLSIIHVNFILNKTL